MKYSFLIPTYNATVLNAKCLETLRKYHPDAEVIINDDGSSPEIQNLLKPIAEKYGAKLLLNRYNYGFSYSVNRMIDAAQADIVILCNNDIEFTENILPKTEEIFNSDDKIGVIGYFLKYKKGTVQHAGHIRVTHNTYGHYCHNMKPDAECVRNKYIIGVTGALMAIRKSMVNEIGVYSPRYFMAYEDVEFCLRTWVSGYRVFYCGDVSAIHEEGTTRGWDEKSKVQKNTFVKEQKSMAQYLADLKNYDLKLMEMQVDKLNGKETGKTVLFKRTAALGDCLLLTGIIERYAKENPKDYIAVATLYPHPFKNNPYIDATFPIPASGGDLKCDRLLDFDMVYENDPSIPIWEAYGKVLGYQDCKPVLYDYYKDGVDLLNLVKQTGINLDLGKWAVINPACTWPSRTLTPEQWQNIVQQLKDQGYSIIIVGTRKDNITPEPGIFDLREKLSLGAIRILIQHVAVFVGMDSGLMHIAMTTKTPVIAFFTVADPFTRIFRKENTYAIVPNSECKYCKNTQKGLVTVECEKLECIKSIDINLVTQALKTVELRKGAQK